MYISKWHLCGFIFLFKLFLNNFLDLCYTYECLAYLHRYTPCACPVSIVVRKRTTDPLELELKQFWMAIYVLGTRPRSTSQVSALTYWAIIYHLSRPSYFYYEVTTLRKNRVKLELIFHFFAFVFPYCAPMALCKLGKYFLPKVYSLAQMRSGWFVIIFRS